MFELFSRDGFVEPAGFLTGGFAVLVFDVVVVGVAVFDGAVVGVGDHGQLVEFDGFWVEVIIAFGFVNLFTGCFGDDITLLIFVDDFFHRDGVRGG